MADESYVENDQTNKAKIGTLIRFSEMARIQLALSLVETNPDVIVRCCDVINCLFTAYFCINHTVIFKLSGEI